MWEGSRSYTDIQILAVQVKLQVRNQARVQKRRRRSKARVAVRCLVDYQEPAGPLELRTGWVWKGRGNYKVVWNEGQYPEKQWFIGYDVTSTKRL